MAFVCEQRQVRVLLNKADSVTQEELLLIQNNLVWNLSPLMASPLPPTLYAGSFWSKPYKPDAPVRLLRAHEENMLKDLRDAMDNVVENTIAEARRHAVIHFISIQFQSRFNFGRFLLIFVSFSLEISLRKWISIDLVGFRNSFPFNSDLFNFKVDFC